MLRQEAVEQGPPGNVREFRPFHVLVNENPSHVALETGRFPWEWMRDHPDKQMDGRTMSLFKSLQTGRFWDVLYQLDGCNSWNDCDTKEVSEEKRRWAKENFTHWELNKLLELAVGVAIAVPFEIGAPGSKRGHSILYRELVEKEDSIFKGSVNPEFEKRLNNGRFWEELADMVGHSYNFSYNVVEDVLMNHFQDLDLEFAPEGYQIFKRNEGENKSYSVSELSDRALNRYIAFIGKIQEKSGRFGLTPEQMAHLVRPYIQAVIRTKGEDEFGEPRFPEDKPRSFVKRLHEPIAVEYLTHSNMVRTEVAKDLHLMACYGTRDLEYVFKLISNMPRPEDMFDLMIASNHNPKYDLEEIVKQSLKENLDMPLGPVSQHMLRG